MAVSTTLDEQILKYVHPEPNTGCWIWGGPVINSGYGQVRYSGKKALAHRASYESARGTIPNGMVIDHLCRVRLCVNPDHLEVVTQSANVRRGLKGGSVKEDGSFACRKCGSVEFYGTACDASSDGIARECKSCAASRCAAYHERNKHKIRARKRAAWAAKKAAK